MDTVRRTIFLIKEKRNRLLCDKTYGVASIPELLIIGYFSCVVIIDTDSLQSRGDIVFGHSKRKNSFLADRRGRAAGVPACAARRHSCRRRSGASCDRGLPPTGRPSRSSVGGMFKNLLLIRFALSVFYIRPMGTSRRHDFLRAAAARAGVARNGHGVVSFRQ